jgi:hypothetical protein
LRSVIPPPPPHHHLDHKKRAICLWCPGVEDLISMARKEYSKEEGRKRPR